MVSASASQLLWPLFAAPPRDDCVPYDAAPCWLCGSPWARGQRVEDWSGANFTGQNRVRCPDALHVCEPCVHICSRVAPVPGRPPKDGKKYGGNFRNYSHLYDAGTYVNASKGEKPLIREWLRAQKRGPWFGAIADSGQKHTLPWVQVNPGSTGAVLFDETVVQLPATLDLVDAMSALLTAGATKEEMAALDYRAETWLRCRAAVEEFERQRGAQRGGSWFTLALWLAQRDEEQVQERLRAEKEEKSAKAGRRAARKAADHDGGGVAMPAGQLPRRVRRKRGAETLGASSDAHAQQREKGDEPGRMGDADAEGASAPINQQLTIPGLG